MHHVLPMYTANANFLPYPLFRCNFSHCCPKFDFFYVYSVIAIKIILKNVLTVNVSSIIVLLKHLHVASFSRVLTGICSFRY